MDAAEYGDDGNISIKIGLTISWRTSRKRLRLGYLFRGRLWGIWKRRDSITWWQDGTIFDNVDSIIYKLSRIILLDVP